MRESFKVKEHAAPPAAETARKEKRALKPEEISVNFVLAKLGVYKSDGTAYIQHIHEIIGTELPVAFDSAANRGAVTTYAAGFSCERALPPFEVMRRSCESNVVAGGGFLFDIFEKKRDKLIEQEQGIVDERRGLAHETFQYTSKVEECREYAYEDGLTKMENGIRDHIEGLRTKEYLHKIEIDGFVGVFWHSEPRLLALLYHDGRIPVFLGGMSRPLKGQIRLIVLHVHSTHNICDNCRVQFTGATYRWLYRKMVTPFIGSDSVAPLFHIVVSWYQEPKRKVDFRSVTSKAEILLEDMATLADTERPLVADTRPFVSIVRLRLPIPASSGGGGPSVAAAAAADDTKA